MDNKKKRFAIAVVVAFSVHILIALFFLCLKVSPRVIEANNLTEIEIYSSLDDALSGSDSSYLDTTDSPNIADPEALNDIAPDSVVDTQQPTVGPNYIPSTSGSASVSKVATSYGKHGNSSGAGKSGGGGGGRAHGVPVVMPRVLEAVQPSYPLQAKRSGIQGRVQLRILVNARGSVDDLSISRSSGNRSLDNAAVNAVQSWIFSPARDERGHVVSCYINMPIDFNLKNKR